MGSRERCTAAENSQDADAWNALDLLWSDSYPQSPCSALQVSSLKAGEAYHQVHFCEVKTLQKEKFNLIGRLNDGWSHSYRVVQRAKDKFGWSRYFYILTQCRIAPVKQCILGSWKAGKGDCILRTFHFTEGDFVPVRTAKLWTNVEIAALR